MIDRDKNFELLPTVDAPNGAVFGIHQHVSLDENGFVPGSTDWAIQDSENSQDGTTNFGRERLLGPTWSWQLHVNRTNETEALETLRSFSTAWRWMHGRDTPGMVTALRYQLDGKQRRIYGRPRRFEAPPDNKILSGYVPVSVDFKCVDGYSYDEDEKQVSLLLGMDLEDEGVDSGGGFIFPVIFPAVTLPPTRKQEQLQVGGEQPTEPVVRFWGPVQDPGIVTDEWTLRLNDLWIPDGQYVEIDLRPWARTVLLNGNASVAGRLGRRQRLNKVRFYPGRFEAKYIGWSPSMSTCDIRWRPKYDSW